MNPHRQVTIGLSMITAGLVAVAVGGAVASHDLFVGLILLVLVPLSVSFCGIVLALIGLVRQPEARSRSTVIRRIIGVAALACAGWGFGFPALGILSQLPDYATGLNGTFLPPTALSVFLLPGLSLLVGLSSGAMIALGWWMIRGRQRAPRAVGYGPR